MAEKRKQTIPLEDMAPFTHSRWLAGFMEAGASMRLTIVRNHQNGHETPQARPEIIYGDTNRQRISLLRGLLGSTGKPRQSKSTEYAVVRGNEAARMAHSIRPDAPSRQSIISAFLEWSQADFTEDRVDIAKRVSGRRVVDRVSPDDYARLVSEPDFVAGVIDCRGRASSIERPDKNDLSYWVTNLLKVNSVNGALLHALQQKHGGQLVQVGAQGETVTIRGRKVSLKNNIFEWILGAENATRLLSWANPKLPLSNDTK